MATAVRGNEGEERQGARVSASERGRSRQLAGRGERRAAEGDGRASAAGVELVPAIGRIVDLRFAEAKQLTLADVAKLVSEALGTCRSTVSGATNRGARFLFRKAGSHWDVVFDGGAVLHLEDSLGARYLDYLLHHANDPISAHELETGVRGERAQARRPDSLQQKLDASAVRSCLRQLTQLRGQRERAVDEGNEGQVRNLDGEIETLEAALGKNGVAGDAGERARDNVRKAIEAVVGRLVKGGRGEKEFGRHLGQFVSKGYQLSYVHPQGAVWE